MKHCLWLVLLLWIFAGPALAAEFSVAKVTPSDGAKGVELDPLIQIHTSEKFDPATISRQAVLLLDAEGTEVPVRLTGDLGGVINVSPERPLEVNQVYQIVVDNRLKSAQGAAIAKFKSQFQTTATQKAAPIGPRHFQFSQKQFDIRDGVCGLALAGPDTLFGCTWRGQLIRYRLDNQGKPQGPGEVVLERPQRRFLSLVADSTSDDEAIVLWLTHDSLAGKSLGPNDFSGTLSRLTIRENEVIEEPFIVGLPTGDHPATGLVFGPEGKLFVSQGALTMLGGKRSLQETILSAATLEIDLQSDAFKPEHRPLNVRTEAPVNYDLGTGPVKLFATGIRQAYDLCWHSNGQLYAGVNMNDTNETTPAGDGVPAISARPPEMLIRIVRGKYYGHPNPARDEWVLLGGNPTENRDPWEVPEYPVGIQPDPNFDPSLLIRNLETDRGPSANGCTEWTAAGPLQGRLMICFYTATRGIHTYQFSEDGTAVVDHQPLLNEKGEILRFGAPLDVVFHPAGHLFVADFSAPERGDSGKNGGVWQVSPLIPAQGPSPAPIAVE